MIHVRNVSKSFFVHEKQAGLQASLRALVRREWRERVALQNVSLHIEEGEIVGLIGANGAGKTTLVKILAGIIPASVGEVRVLGYNPWDRANAFRRQISLIMGQKAQLWWDLPAADSFLLLREIYQVPRDEFRRRLDELCQALEVREQLTVPIRKLSLGERMKMELIAALLHRPRVVFLDEPTIGLDLTAQRSIRRFLLDYRERYRPAMLITSHYMEDIEQLCQRIVVIRDGAFVYDGPLARVAKEYGGTKVVALRVEEGATIDALPAEIAARVIELNGDQLRLEVRREDLSRVVARVLRELPVHDLSVEEEDIGVIIERLMRRRREAS